MRGHWETAEPLVLAPNQQQQQTIVQEQQHTLHSATTPAWGIADRIVKEEPVEDKNNDSGVSPGHYTSNSASPHSRRSSTANCSLSPGSATSQDSNNMQCGSFDYSPQRIYKSCDSPPEFVRHHPMDDHQSVDQSMDVVSNTMKQSNEDVDFVQDTLQCPICAFTTTNKVKFTEHVTAHCTTKCDTPDFMKAVLGQLAAPGSMQDETDRVSPTQSDRFEQESEEAEEPGLRVPRINSQGKVKTFRCKQCNFAAITKLEFWEHSRGHIKAEKLLTCPKCPFVTEYKHHLEYHLRNHIGSKPFKCDKCSYSCVNKSMLNSHLKSHSNVYQYRCANCSYATKYCHSLKLHLRKYSHQPAMVLNADGSPNPLPIIDVYGTRRGPKQKPMKNEDDNAQGMNMVTNNNVQSPLVQNQMTVTPQISPVSHHLDVNSVNGVNGIGTMNGLTGANGMNGMNGMNVVNPVSPSQPTMIPFPYNPLFSGFPLTNRFPVFEEMSEKKMDHVKSNLLMEYAKTMSTQRPQEEFPQDLAVRCFGINGGKFADGFPPANGTTQMAMGSPGAPTATSPIIPNTVDAHEEAFESKAAPLDLSKPEVSQSNQQEQQHRGSVNSPRATGTSRRKGRAVKLARRVIEDETDEDVTMRLDTEEPSARPPNDAAPPLSGSPESKDEEEKGSFASISSELTCQYCEIVFGNDVMYTVHMGYHGYNDPFTCNMCGHQCTDKVSFFLHIARSKHA